MKEKKNIITIFICICIYMLLSWIIKAGTFSTGELVVSGFNQVGLLDLFLAPFEVFNSFVVTRFKFVDETIIEFGYGNIILAFISIGILYGVLNRTRAYHKLVMTTANKLKNNEYFIYVLATSIFIISALTGLELIIFMFIPFLTAVMLKQRYTKVTIFTSTIGAMLMGRLASLYNPVINGLNKVIFSVEINDNIGSRLAYFILLLIILIGTLYLNKNKKTKTESEEILFLEDKKSTKKSFMPIIIVHTIVTIILFICMYNWYYIFNVTSIGNAKNSLMDVTIANYPIMKNIFGMSENFGYWTGFTMSALLLIESVILAIIYKVNYSKFIKGVKKGIETMLPTILVGSLSLVIIVISLNNSDSFLYTIIDKIFNASDNVILGVLPSSILHNFFINDYFALTSILANPILSVYGKDNISLALLITQMGHGISSLLSPFNIYLMAGLTYVGLSYKEWIKSIWKTLLIIVGVSIVILFVTTLI